MKMLETSTKHILCGGIIDNDEFTEIYCDPETGDCAFESTTDGAAILIGEVSVDNPLAMLDLAPLKKNLLENKFGGAIGIICRTNGAIAILPDEKAEERELLNIAESTGDTFDIDLDQQYDYKE
jgi:hypothetical protein